MATSFVPQSYLDALQALLDRQDVGVKVYGLEPGALHDRLKDGPVAEWFFEDFRTTQVGAPGMLDGVLTAGLRVVLVLADALAEVSALELAFEVATSLVDEIDAEAYGNALEAGEEPPAPLMPGSPILVTSIEPAELEGAMGARCAGYVVMYEQQLRVARSNLVAATSPYTKLWIGRDPDVGAGHEADYHKVVG